MEVNDVCFFNINKPNPSDIVASRAIDKPDYICHFGILGMKWGVRRYQNEDGTLTEEGKRRYTTKDEYTGVARLNARGHWATLLSKHKELKSTLLDIDEQYHKAYRNLADKEDKRKDDALKKIDTQM